ncbi:MAG TPA: MFS transporter [Candidatus Bathyarchaeota archaeon]|nr:MFS transporter [Candidatus Bathyarchaeota archaeon]
MGLGRFVQREFSFVRGNYLTLVVSWILMDIGMEMPVPYYQQYVDALGGNVFPMALGIIGFANYFAMAFVAVPGGFLADKFGRRWLIVTMTFGMALSYLFFVLAPFWQLTASWHLILVGTIIQSLCLIYQPALFAMVQDSVPPENRGVGSSLINMIHGTFNTPGTVIGGILVVSLGLIAGMQAVYLIVMTLFIVAAIWRIRLKETIVNTEKMRFRYFISSYSQAIKESLRVWKIVPRTVFWLFTVQVITMFSLALTTVINAIYARDVLGIAQNQWFLVYIPMLITMVVASYPVGKMVDKVGMKLPLAIGPAVLVVSMLLFISGNLFSTMVSIALFGLVHLFIMSSAMALSACLVEPKNRGKITGGVNFVGYILTGAGMILGNFLYNLTPQLPFYLTIALVIPTMLIIIFRIPEPKREDRKY